MKDVTPVADWVKILASNSDSAAWPSRIPTTSKPSGSGVFPGGCDLIETQIFGAGADTNTTAMRVIGWNKVGTLWVPEVICQLTAALSIMTGVAGAPVVATDLFADAITVAEGADKATTHDAPADTITSVLVTTKGYELLEFTFNRGVSATNSNGLFRRL